jgi:hypothetical protein
LYLVAILDVASRKVLSFRVSNTMTPDFCVEALEEAIARFGAPEIMNTDQGSQFTSAAWTDVLKAEDTSISMDGKGRWIDNVFIERLWRSVKYEDVYLRAYENGREVQAGLTRYFDFYNRETHSSVARVPNAGRNLLRYRCWQTTGDGGLTDRDERHEPHRSEIGGCSGSGYLTIAAPTTSYSIKFSRPRGKPGASAACGIRLRLG